MVSKSTEIIVLLSGTLLGIAVFILILFYCTRHQKRIQDDSLRHAHDNRSAPESNTEYFGALGWFQRYYNRQLNKDDSSTSMNRI